MNAVIQLAETQMKYLEERSLFYYFLMREIVDGTQGGGNRLRVPSHTYDRDHAAGVVYALKPIGSDTSACARGFRRGKAGKGDEAWLLSGGASIGSVSERSSVETNFVLHIDKIYIV